MSIPSLCKSISSTLSHNLRLATSDEQRNAFAAAALDEMGKRIFPELDRLLVHKGETSDDYLQAREAVLELIPLVTIPFVRSCSDYGWGIAFLEGLVEKSGHSQVKKKVVIYSNQLRKRWNEAEPGGIAHNPRAKQVRQQVNESKSFANALTIMLLLVSALYFLTHIDFTTLLFPRWNEPRPQSAPQMQPDRQKDAAPPVILHPTEQPPKDAAPQAPAASGSFFSYTDDRGIVHIVDDYYKVPQEYRQTMTVTRSATPRDDLTRVVIKENRVLVPVTLSYRGRSVEASLLLDTGASVTTINERIANILGIDAADVRAGKATVADGRSVGSYSFLADSITVGVRSLPRIQASILPGSGGEGYDGLLGMNFLKNFRYHVDFNRSVIEWGG